MDIINYYLERIPNGKKRRVSDFMLEMETHVARVPYNTDGVFSASQIRSLWTHLLEQFREFFILDFNIVNWKHVLQLTMDNAWQKRASYTINLSNHTIDNAETRRTTIPFDMNTVTLKDEIKTLTTEARMGEGDDTKRDYLYYGILDFVTKKDDKKNQDITEDQL
ncbi:hypothetical protein INT47_012696 [Mucor saturninus]|uniref:Uncharacterized protein n=1 Tax=Mucor saturninus TaxID=64648 RepID=A0A8H7R3W9_9FUNG|nr:hypothetical protein INT47_012696 [Mucor saturninus]